MIDSSIDLFKDFFKDQPDSTSFASGRVNLIGDHTDYNSGFVMPTPLSLGIEVSLKPTQTRLIQGKTNLFSETERQINAKTDGTWLDFVSGAIKVFYEEFPNCSKSLEKGIQLVVSSNLPSSSGVSSSAALEIALLRAINKIENQNLSQIKLAKLAQKIEHNFIGTKCGLMDQMVVSCGNMNKAMYFDVLNEKIINLPLFNDYEFLVVHSGSQRTLSNSLYNQRRKECEKASKLLKIQNLREANHQMLDKLNGKLFNRTKHVISENERVISCLELLKKNDAKTFGEKMYESHASLSKDYEVSSELLDNIIIKSKSLNILGGRLTGAGFGGCCVFLAERGSSKNILKFLNLHFENLSLVDII